MESHLGASVHIVKRVAKKNVGTVKNKRIWGSQKRLSINRLVSCALRRIRDYFTLNFILTPGSSALPLSYWTGDDVVICG